MKLASYISEEYSPMIKPPTITIIKKEEDIQDRNIIKIKLCCTPKNAAPEIYEFKMGTFESGSPKEILQI